MTKYFDQVEDLEPRTGQSPPDLLKIRLNLVTKFVKDFHQNFVDTHKEELGDMAEIEATQFSKHYGTLGLLHHFLYGEDNERRTRRTSLHQRRAI